MLEYLLTVALIIVLIIAAVYLLRLLKFAMKRLWFAFRLFIKSTFCKGFEYCYKKPLSVFSGRKNNTSDMMVFYGGTIYIIKLCGFFQKRTDVTVNKEDIWQIDTYTAGGRWLTGLKGSSAEKVLFNLPSEKSGFENNIWNIPDITEINTMLLLLPKPRGFGIRVETHVEWLSSGNMCGGNIVGTARYFWETLKEIKEESNTFTYIEKDHWETLKKEYKKVK